MDIELYELLRCVFGLAVVRRLFHDGLRDILPLRGEPHDHSGFYHTPSHYVVTRGASAGRGNLTLDFLYLSDGYSIQEKDCSTNTLKQPGPIRSAGCRGRELLLVYWQTSGGPARPCPSGPQRSGSSADASPVV